MAKQALAGIRVLDLTVVWSGPYGGKLLADMGADVIKIQNQPPPEFASRFSSNPYTTMLLGNREGLCIDLSMEKGKEIFKRLVAISDIVLENFSVKVMKKLELDYDSLKAVKDDIIMVSMPAFGATGPESHYVGYGVNIEQLAGMVALTGYLNGPPMKSGINYGDPTAGVTMAGAALAALNYRKKTGKGQFIDISQREGVTCFLGEAVLEYTMNKRVIPRMGNRHPSMAPHGVYRCKGEDRWIAIAIDSDERWKSLCQVIGNPELAKEENFSDTLSRWKNQMELDRLLNEWTVKYTDYELMEKLQAVGIAAQPVLSNTARLEDHQLKARGFYQEVTHPEAGSYLYPKPPWMMSKTPPEIRTPSPRLGEHNEQVLSRLLGMTKEEIADLYEEEVLIKFSS
ncbi:MAG: CoA transferase [Candidatus Tectomicrobia bacterium]|nr:CoA transferase [Candidatus Tectomicrobia bacterium]